LQNQKLRWPEVRNSTRGTVAQIHRACAMFDDALGPEGRAELRTPRSNSRYAGVPIYLPEWDPFRIFSVRNRRERTREPQGGNGPTHRSIKKGGPVSLRLAFCGPGEKRWMRSAAKLARRPFAALQHRPRCTERSSTNLNDRRAVECHEGFHRPH
jgi:hypothetical protein